MKKIFFLMLVVAFTMQAGAQFTKANLQATGLTCAMCSNAINKALQKVPFVESVKSNIRNSSFEIVFRPNVTVDIDALKDAVEDAGFAIGLLKLTGVFSGVKIGTDQHVQIGDQQFCFLNTDQQTLNGEQTLTVADKNFLTAREYKRLSSSAKTSCQQTGSTRVYHVTI